MDDPERGKNGWTEELGGVGMNHEPDSAVSTIDPFTALDFLLQDRYDGLEPLIENEPDGSLLVLVPGGTFLAGGPGSDEGRGQPFRWSCRRITWECTR